MDEITAMLDAGIEVTLLLTDGWDMHLHSPSPGVYHAEIGDYYYDFPAALHADPVFAEGPDPARAMWELAARGEPYPVDPALLWARIQECAADLSAAAAELADAGEPGAPPG